MISHKAWKIKSRPRKSRMIWVKPRPAMNGDKASEAAILGDYRNGSAR
jgi:hypothetical protein